MANVWRVDYQMTGVPGAPYYGAMHFEPGDDNLDAFSATSGVREFWSDLAPYLDPSIRINVAREVPVIDMVTGDQVDMIVTDATTQVSGTGSGDRLPWVVQGLIQWRTGAFVSGREIRGRTYIPTPAESANDAGLPNSTYRTALEDAADALLAATGDATLSVYSPTHHQLANISHGTAWTKWAELRSRRD